MEDSASENQELINVSSNNFSSFFDNKSLRYIFFGVLFAVIANIVVLDVIFFNSKRESLTNTPLAKDKPSITASPLPTTQPTPQSASEIKEQNEVITPTPTITPDTVSDPASTPTPVVSALREYFIPLGQGNGGYADWTAVPGMGAKLDIANYGDIEKVYFEATVRIPTGNQKVYVRLYNSNNFQAIANSELSLEGGATTLLTSQPITLNSGNNLYQVQLKTQLQFSTYIDQARVRIVSR